MAGVTDKELDKKREKVEKLRADLAQAEAQRSALTASTANEIVAAQLDLEAQRMENALKAMKGTATAKAVEAGTATTLDSLKQQMVAAQEAAKVGAETTVPHTPADATT